MIAVTASSVSPTGRRNGLTRRITAPNRRGGSLNHRNTEISAELGVSSVARAPVTARPTSPIAIAVHGHLPVRRSTSVARRPWLSRSRARRPVRRHDRDVALAPDAVRDTDDQLELAPLVVFGDVVAVVRA